MKVTRQSRDMQKVFDYLRTYGPERRLVPQWAHFTGLTEKRVRNLIQITRGREFINDHGWTIPHVGHGGGMANSYAVVYETRDQPHLERGVEVEMGDVIGKLRIYDAQLDFALARESGDPLVRILSHQVKGMLQMADALSG